MRNAYGLAAALLAASMTSPYSDLFGTKTPRREPKTRTTSPNDHSPVIDTTRESKRARRRRLAKATAKSAAYEANAANNMIAAHANITTADTIFTENIAVPPAKSVEHMCEEFVPAPATSGAAKL